MAATASKSIDNVVVPENVINTTDEAFDPLPDETVLKTGWLSKKGRRGVRPLAPRAREGDVDCRTGRNDGLYYAQTDLRTTRMRGYNIS